MSIHIEAKQGDIAPFVLLPGDPLRARFIADNFFENPVCYNQVRGMHGYTGTYKGNSVSVQGTGMGIPSISIYAHELICDYDVKTLVRIGTCGSFSENLKVREVVLAQGASTDSSFNKLKFNGMDYAPLADFELLCRAYDYAKQRGIKAWVANVLTSDTFYYDDNSTPYDLWRTYGLMAVEMEAAALYTIAARFRRQALAILTVSNHLLTGEELSSLARQQSFNNMVEIALALA